MRGFRVTLAAVVLLAFMPTVKVQLGVRYVLPLVALAGVGLAAAVVRGWQTASARWQRPVLTGATAAGVLWSAAAAMSVWPNGLCYTNELWGGTANGYRLLSDSNYDWGQGLNELARWQCAHGVERMDVWYFGTDPALRTLPMDAVALHKAGGAGAVTAQLHGGYLAASTTLLCALRA